VNTADTDLPEIQEWLVSVDALVTALGTHRAERVLDSVVRRAREAGIELGSPLATDYINTISPEEEAPFPGDEALETRLRHYVQWNAAVMVARANRRVDGIGGHLATYASAATLYEVGFNHFFRGKTDERFGDQIFFQGHASPGIYACISRGTDQRTGAGRIPP